MMLFLAPSFYTRSRAIMGTLPAICLAVFALAMALQYLSDGRRRWLAWAGVSLAASLLVKPITAYIPAVLGLTLVLRERPGGWQREWRALLTDSMLLLATIALPVAWVLATYDLGGFYEQVVGTYLKSRSTYSYEPLRNASAIWGYLRGSNFGLTVMAGVGSLWLATQRWRQGLWLAIWLLVTLAIALTQSPLFPQQHLTILLFPLAIGAGLVLDALWVCLRAKAVGSAWRVMWIGASLAALLGYAGSLPDTLTADSRLLSAGSGGEQAEAVPYLRALTRPDDIVISDSQMAAFWADRMVIPELGDTGIKRIESGLLTGEEMIRLTEAYQPAAVVLWDRRLTRLPAYVEWLKNRYRLALALDAEHRIYVSPGRPTTLTPVGTRLGEQISLVGYSMDGTTVESGAALYLFIAWQALRQPDKNYTAFLHLLDHEGNVWGIRDQELHHPDWGTTSQWPSGLENLEGYKLRIRPGTPPGTYTLAVGLYETGDQTHRLSARDANGIPVGTSFSLATIIVRAPRDPERSFDLEAIQRPLAPEPHFVQEIALMGSNTPPASVKPGDKILLTLYWRALRRPQQEYGARFQIRDQAGQVWAGGQWPLAGIDYPTTVWPSNAKLAGQFDVMVAGGTAPGPAQVEVVAVDAAGQEVGQPVALFTVNVAAISRTFEIPTMQRQVDAILGGTIKLLGYDLTVEGCELKVEGLHAQNNGNLQPATLLSTQGKLCNLHLILYWQAQIPVSTSYTVFTHVLDDKDRIWGQLDQVPAGGFRPTTSWAPGEVIADAHVLTLKPDTPPGVLVIEVGMYDPRTGQRLPVVDRLGHSLQHDRILLEQLTIVRQ